MTPNSENVMARFCFAILKQINLRDVDWNQVASDPVLLEPISNGHAARMRFFRFRKAVMGKSSNRRGPVLNSRVTKSKKDQAGKKTLIKSEFTPTLSIYDDFSPATASLASPYIGETQDDFNRLLTPCSPDMAQNLVVHPAAMENSRIQNMPLFPPASCSTEFLNHAVPEPVRHASPPSVSAFDAAYDLGAYGVRGVHSRPHSNSSRLQELSDCTHHWDDRFHDTPQF